MTDTTSDLDDRKQATRELAARQLIEVMNYKPSKLPDMLMDGLDMMLSGLDISVDRETLNAKALEVTNQQRTRLYAERMTLPELLAALEFYKGPVGQKLLDANHAYQTDIESKPEEAMALVFAHLKKDDGTRADLETALLSLLADGDAPPELIEQVKKAFGAVALTAEASCSND